MSRRRSWPLTDAMPSMTSKPWQSSGAATAGRLAISWQSGLPNGRILADTDGYENRT